MRPTRWGCRSAAITAAPPWAIAVAFPPGAAHTVDHPVVRSGLDQLGDPLRGPILDVAVGPGRHRRRLVHRLERGDGIVVSEVGAETLDHPVGIGQARSRSG